MTDLPEEPEETTNPADEAEDPGARADSLMKQLRDSVKLDLTEYGGAEGFIRWVRGRDDEEE